MPYQYAGYDDPMETMYPRIYYKLQPEILRRSDRFFLENGPYYNPSYEYIGEMVNEIVDSIEYDESDFDMDMDNRQFGPRRFLTTLATVLLINELVGRRRPFHHHHRHGYY